MFQGIQLDIQTKFNKLFQIGIQHDYYQNGQCPKLGLVPTQACLRLFSKFGFRSRPSSSGMDVGFKAETEESLFDGYDTSKLRFSFLLIQSDHSLNSLSELPSDRKNRVYYFHNIDRTTDGDLVPLQNEMIAGESDLIHLVPDYLEMRLSDFSGETNLILKDHLGNTLRDEPMHVAEDGLVRVVLSEEEDGFYELSVHDQELSFYKTSQKVNRIFGIIDVYATPGISGDGSLMENGIPANKIYQIHIGARRTFWRYFVVSKSNPSQFSDHEIVGGGSHISFTPAELVKLQNGLEGFQMVSESMVNAAEKFPFTLQLKFTKTTGASRAYELDLPFPDPTNFKLDGEGNLYSDVLIYV